MVRATAVIVLLVAVVTNVWFWADDTDQSLSQAPVPAQVPQSDDTAAAPALSQPELEDGWIERRWEEIMAEAGNRPIEARLAPETAVDAPETKVASTEGLPAPFPVRQTAYFDSSESLPPGVLPPEGVMPASESAAPHLAGTTFDVANLSAPTGIAPAGDISTVAAAEAPGRLRPIRRNFPPIEEAPESEFAPLGTGHDLTGWVVQDGQSQAWKASDGIVRCARGNGGWLRTEQEFGNFELRFDVCIGDGANTGVAFRFPGTGSPTLSGIELQLIDDGAEKYASLRPDQHTGSLYYLLPPLEYHPLVPGEWHAVQLLVRGDHIRITVDGTMVNETFLDQLPASEKPHPLRTRPKTGHIGLQCSASEVQFRRLRIRDLTQE